MSSTSSDTYKINLPSDIQYTIDMAIQCFSISTLYMTRMRQLQLKQLLELSCDLDVKLYLNTIFVPVAAVILNRQPSQYIKDKLLEIIANICHIDKVIENIGQDKQLVQFILGSFGKCAKNFRLQGTLFQLLLLITCEIESNTTSEWKNHLTRSTYLLGPNILRILTQELPLYCSNILLTKLLALLESLSGLTLPNGPNILEQIFKIDDLVSALLMWFSKMFCFKDYERVASYMFTQRYWIIVDMWVKILSAITKFTSFKLYPLDLDNDINRVFILIAISSNLYSFREILYEVNYNALYVECFENATPYSIGPIYRNVLFLQSCFSGNTIFSSITDSTVDILNTILKHSDNDVIVENNQVIKVKIFLNLFQVQRTYQVLQHLQQCYEEYVRMWSYKNILENLLIWDYSRYCTIISKDELRDSLYIFLTEYNIPQNVHDKILKIIRCHELCWYILED